MKNPLQYQSTEYDCGPSSVINAVSFLFEREEIPPELIINVMRFCLDRSGSDGSPGKGGTSCAAMRSLCSTNSPPSENSRFSHAIFPVKGFQ